MRTFEYYKNQAIDLLNKGFTSKASKKNALSQILYAYEALTGMIREELLNVPIEERLKTEEHSKLYWGLPAYPHIWNKKHSKLSSARFPKETKEIEILVELRNAIKETEVVPLVKIETPEQIKANKIEKTIEEIMEAKKVRFLEGYSLTEEFGGLEVTANSHWGMNQHGTQFIRTFYYLFGKVTALNTICAIYGKHKDEHPELYKEAK